MKNTTSCPSFDFPQGRRVNILGKELLIKNHICSPDGITYKEKPEKFRLQLTVCPTSYCSASCPFCIATNTKHNDRLDLKHLEKTLLLLKEEELVRGVSISGGEPFTDITLLDETLSVIFETLGLHTEVSISTNGFRPELFQRLRYLSYVDAIHISRHHYDDRINQQFFGIPMPSSQHLGEVIRSIPYKDLFVLNCMLLRDYINSPEEAHRFLDYAIALGVPKVAFMVCTPINAYAKAQTIEFESIIRRDDPSLLFTRGYWDHQFCHCQDGVYVSPNGALIEFYGRSTNAGSCPYCRGLVYRADGHLYNGFSEERII